MQHLQISRIKSPTMDETTKNLWETLKGVWGAVAFAFAAMLGLAGKVLVDRRRAIDEGVINDKKVILEAQALELKNSQAWFDMFTTQTNRIQEDFNARLKEQKDEFKEELREFKELSEKEKVKLSEQMETKASIADLAYRELEHNMQQMVIQHKDELHKMELRHKDELYAAKRQYQKRESELTQTIGNLQKEIKELKESPQFGGKERREADV